MNKAVVKIILTILVTLAIVLPMLSESSGSGILREVEQLGWPGAIALAILLLILVAFYCRDLQRTLEAISPPHRVSSPKSVWYMFLIPYNFVEDFFIVANIAKSLELQGTDIPWLKRYSPYGKYTGLGWCSAQICSIAPGYIGQVASVITIVFWVMHWRFIRKINVMLKGEITT